MAADDEEALRRLGGQGDERAFAQLIRPYRQVLARYIHYQVTNAEDAEDVLQETLLAAWLGLDRLRDAGSVHAWLMQVARNRCRDYFRAQGRRDVPAGEQELETFAGRFGLSRHRRAQAVADIVDALEDAPPAAREAARRFYLEGLSVAEIAAETSSPPGTVKRRLFQARSSLRASLGVSPPQRSYPMNTQMNTQMNIQTPDTPTVAVPVTEFPPVLPEIVITESDEPPFAVDCPELLYWSVIPRLGEWASWADYDLPGWTLAEAGEARVLRPARVHNVEGVEIEMRFWKPEEGWLPTGTVHGRLTEEGAQWLAVNLVHKGEAQVETFLDEVFDLNWRRGNHPLEDRGAVESVPDGSLRLRDRAAVVNGVGAGLFTVEIGAKRFTCLRVLECDIANEVDTLVACYLTREGRTVLVRRYKRPSFVQTAEFPVILDETDPLVVDGLTFLHWYDTITNLAL